MARRGGDGRGAPAGEDLIGVRRRRAKFYAELIGPAPDAPVRIVAARRGAGFELGGTLLVYASFFAQQD